MNNFILRTISGAVYVMLVAGAILGGPLLFGIFSFALLFLCLKEYRLIAHVKGDFIPFPFYFIINLLSFVLAALVANQYLPFNYISLILLLLFSIFLIPVINIKNNSTMLIGHYLISFVYIAVPLSLLNFFHVFLADDQILNYTLLGIFVIIWINDSFAYMIGSLIGRNKLSKEISPKKTWEGSIGGLIFSLLSAYGLYRLFGGLTLFEWFGFALIIVIFGTFGDLFESVLKRKAGLKESGDLIPGHGGILDRLDSLLLATPFVFVYLLLVLK